MSEKNILFTDHTRSGDHAARTYMDVTYPVNDKLLIYPGDPIYEHHRHSEYRQRGFVQRGTNFNGLSYRNSYGCTISLYKRWAYH